MPTVQNKTDSTLIRLPSSAIGPASYALTTLIHIFRTPGARCQTYPRCHRVLRYPECCVSGHSRHLGCSFAICSLIRLRKSRGLAIPWNGFFKPPVPVIVTEPKLKMRPRCLIVYAKKVGDSFGAVEMNSILTPTSANPIVVIRYFIKML